MGRARRSAPTHGIRLYVHLHVHARHTGPTGLVQPAVSPCPCRQRIHCRNAMPGAWQPENSNDHTQHAGYHSLTTLGFGWDPIRSPPTLRHRATPMIYYLNPINVNTPIGGVKKFYDHVRCLNNARMPAAVIQARAGFRPTWFPADDVPVVHAPVQLTSLDLLVVPEISNAELPLLAPGIPKVSLVQNPHLMFPPHTGAAHPYHRTDDLVGVLAVSEHARMMLEQSFSDLPVWRFYVSVDSTRFAPRSDTRSRAICYMPRKRARDIDCVLGILQSRGSLDDWSLRPLDGCTEAEVAEALSDCAIFLSFSDQEGCPLPPLEAMASGALVVGYTGFGANEYMTADTAVVVPEADVLAFAHQLESVLFTWNSHRHDWDRIRHSGRTAATNKYSKEVEAASLVSAFTELSQKLRGQPQVTRTLTRQQASHISDPVSSRMEVRRHALRLLRRSARSMRALFGP